MPLPVLSLMLVVFSFTTGEFVIAGILPEVAIDLAVSVPSAGLLVTAYAVGMIVGGPVVTVLTAGTARKRLILGLVGVSVLANLASTVAPGHGVLLVARFAAGLVVATFFAVAIATVTATAGPGKEASAVAKVTLGMNLGIILGTPIGTFVGQNWGWRATFACLAAFTLLALTMVLRFVPTQDTASDSAAPTGPRLAQLRVFSNQGTVLAIALTAIGNLGVVTVFTYIAPLLTEVSGFATGTVPVLLLVYGVGAVLGNIVGGRLADRALLPTVAWSLTALAAALALFWLFGDQPIPAVALTFVLGVLAFAIIPGMQTRVLASAPAAPILAIAVNASGFQLAAAFAGWLGGQVVDSSLGLSAVPLVGIVPTVVGIAIAAHLLRGDRRAVERV